MNFKKLKDNKRDGLAVNILKKISNADEMLKCLKEKQS